jgi:hypothetical protein
MDALQKGPLMDGQTARLHDQQREDEAIGLIRRYLGF